MFTSGFSRVLILGHTGYIGSRLAAAFGAMEPPMPVTGWSAPTLDLTLPESAAVLASALDADCALVVCAAIKKQLGDTLDVLTRNLTMVMNVCRALELAPVRRVVFFSSAAVYGEDVPHATAITEATPVEPTSLYGIGKFTAERLLRRTVAAQPGSSLLILRPALVYGPHEPGYYYGPSGFLSKARARSPITLWGDGRELREFLFVDDVVDIVRRLTLGSATGVLNVVSGASRTYVDALDAVAAIAGGPPEVVSRPRSKDKVDHRFDNTALRRACPDAAFTPLVEALRRIAAAEPVAAGDGR
jgi:nucleoside-diphosphate-sugar epimerase